MERRLAKLAKFLTGIVAGMPARTNMITQVIFITNFASMTAIAAMYQDAPERLCNDYFCSAIGSLLVADW